MMGMWHVIEDDVKNDHTLHDLPYDPPSGMGGMKGSTRQMR